MTDQEKHSKIQLQMIDMRWIPTRIKPAQLSEIEIDGKTCRLMPKAEQVELSLTKIPGFMKVDFKME